MLQKYFHTSEVSMDLWPFWMFEENIKLVNEILEDEDKQRKKEEDTQSKNTPNFNANSYMKDMSGMTNKFKP